MRYGTMQAAILEAKRFLALAEQVKFDDNSGYPDYKKRSHHAKDSPFSSPKITGAVRRASLDLTRALAEMRKP